MRFPGLAIEHGFVYSRGYRIEFLCLRALSDTVFTVTIPISLMKVVTNRLNSFFSEKTIIPLIICKNNLMNINDLDLFPKENHGGNHEINDTWITG